jgi:hypothetical protein
VPDQLREARNRRNALEERMLREIVVEQETSDDFRTTFRLCADGNVIAENVTELETYFDAQGVFR